MHFSFAEMIEYASVDVTQQYGDMLDLEVEGPGVLCSVIAEPGPEWKCAIECCFHVQV